MRSDDERLLDVGRLGRAADERAESTCAEIELGVGPVKIRDQSASTDDDDHVLGQEVERTIRDAILSYPHGAVFRDAELARENRQPQVGPGG
jgi:hypothetical protein